MRWYKLLIGLLAVVFLSFSDRGNNKYPQAYFRSPVDQTIYLSGTFGELRPNHFHSGIDIKARNGRIGQPLYSCADGFVSRIKVQPGGYGNALYIDHPNGYTTVFAHLKDYSEKIEAYIRSQQFKKKSFSVDLYPSPGSLSVKKGEVIGHLGLSGTSFGPHLHFEIRDTKTEEPINPLLFGFEVKDNLPPRLHQLRIYSLNQKNESFDSQTFSIRGAPGNYYINKDTVIAKNNRVGFALKTYDHMNGVSNWNGVYNISTFIDDSLVYEFEMERFSFDETRYINAHMDYQDRLLRKSYFNRCYRLPGNQLSAYPIQKNDGVVELSGKKAKKVTILSKDIKGNQSELSFFVKGSEGNLPTYQSYNYLLPYNEKSLIENGSIYLFFPKGCLYEDLYLQYASTFEKSFGTYSSTHHIHNFKTPVHTYFDIGIIPVDLPDSLKSKAFIAYCDNRDNIVNYGGEWKDGMLMAKVRDLGDFSIMVDQEPPDIKPVIFRSNLRGASKIAFRISDNYKTARNAPELQYFPTIDDEWVLMDYDKKNQLITHYFDSDLPQGKHQFRLTVIDNQGNEQVFERSFYR